MIDEKGGLVWELSKYMVPQYGQIMEKRDETTGITESDQEWEHGLLSLTCQMHCDHS